MAENRPTKAQIERHAKLKRAADTATWIRTRGHVPRKYINNVLKKEYYKGLCHICQDWPVYKVSQDCDGATLISFWCEKHKEQIPE